MKRRRGTMRYQLVRYESPHPADAVNRNDVNKLFPSIVDSHL